MDQLIYPIKTMKNLKFQPFKISVNIPYGIFLSSKIKLIQGDLQSNFNSFSEMDSGACKEINIGFVAVQENINRRYSTKPVALQRGSCFQQLRVHFQIPVSLQLFSIDRQVNAPSKKAHSQCSGLQYILYEIYTGGLRYTSEAYV